MQWTFSYSSNASSLNESNFSYRRSKPSSCLNEDWCAFIFSASSRSSSKCERALVAKFLLNELFELSSTLINFRSFLMVSDTQKNWKPLFRLVQSRIAFHHLFPFMSKLSRLMSFLPLMRLMYTYVYHESKGKGSWEMKDRSRKSGARLEKELYSREFLK